MAKNANLPHRFVERSPAEAPAEGSACSPQYPARGRHLSPGEGGRILHTGAWQREWELRQPPGDKELSLGWLRGDSPCPHLGVAPSHRSPLCHLSAPPWLPWHPPWFSPTMAPPCCSHGSAPPWLPPPPAPAMVQPQDAPPPISAMVRPHHAPPRPAMDQSHDGSLPPQRGFKPHEGSPPPPPPMWFDPGRPPPHTSAQGSSPHRAVVRPISPPPPPPHRWSAPPPSAHVTAPSGAQRFSSQTPPRLTSGHVAAAARGLLGAIRHFPSFSSLPASPLPP